MPLSDDESAQVSVQERQADEDWLARWYEVLPEIEEFEAIEIGLVTETNHCDWFEITNGLC